MGMMCARIGLRVEMSLQPSFRSSRPRVRQKRTVRRSLTAGDGRESGISLYFYLIPQLYQTGVFGARARAAAILKINGSVDEVFAGARIEVEARVGGDPLHGDVPGEHGGNHACEF